MKRKEEIISMERFSILLKQYDLAVNTILELHRMHIQIGTALFTIHIGIVSFAITDQKYYLILAAVALIIIYLHFIEKRKASTSPVFNSLRDIERKFETMGILHTPMMTSYEKTVYTKAGRGKNETWTIALLIIVAILEVCLMIYFLKGSN